VLGIAVVRRAQQAVGHHGRVTGPTPTPETLELRHLRSFVAVAQELNFGRAAARLYVSQSALSRQIATLERMLGCVLFTRSTQNVALTLAGAALLERTPAILAAVDDAVAATRSIGGELAARIRRLGEPFDDITYADVAVLREVTERHYAQLPQADVEIHPVNAGGVPTLVATPEHPGRTCVVLLHGGSYVTGSAFGFRSLAGAIAHRSGCAVYTPDFRLAPEHPYPAAVDDAEACYRWLADSCDDLVLVGDTSGAGHVFSLLFRLEHLLPARCVFFTPWVDIGMAAPDRLPGKPAHPATRAGAALGIAHYLAGHPADDPLLNPLRADLTGMPPMLIQAAAGDEGLPDAERLTEHARAHGVEARLEIYPVAAQSFQLYWSFLPEAADALDQVARFIAPAR
jgi:monoterpene epsilon-lactone hydrolase